MERLSLKSVNGGKRMKRITCILRLLLSFTLCFTADFKVIRDTKIYDGDYNYMGDLKKGQIVQLWDCSVRNQSNNDKLNFNYSLRLKIDGEKRLVDACSIVPAETKDLFDPDIVTTSLRKNGKYWTYVEDCDVLFSRDRKTYYEKNKAAIEHYEQKVRGSYDGPWYENVTISPSAIYNVSITLNNDSRVMLFVKNIHKTANGYKVLTEVLKYDSFEYRASYKFIKETFIPKAEITLKIVRDGEYLHFYTEDGRTIISCALVDEEFATQYENLIQTNKCDLSRVTWPRHADGTCDYETAVRLQSGKRYRASDNLRLRSSGSTAGKPVVTIGKGTQVKVLSIGAEQTLDGITSNWVQVEVLAGAKDRDGKAIAAGTVGWCFGGYLE